MSDSPHFSSLERSMAVCLSVRRLDCLERLAGGFLAQGYERSHVFAAVKGVTEDCFRDVVQPRYRSWIDEGRLTLRYYPMKNRVSDLLDTVRGMELGDWELFLFPKEDFCCSPGLLERVNRVFDQLPSNCSGYEGGVCRAMRECRGYQYVEDAGGVGCPGVPPFYVLTREAVDVLLECERDPACMASLFPDGRDPKHGAYGLDADALMMRVIMHLGGQSLSAVDGYVPLLAPVPATPQNPLAEQEEILHEEVCDDPARAEYLVELEHPQWNDCFRILGVAGCRVRTGGRAAVLRYTDRELVLEWEKGGRERFTRKKQAGAYILKRASGGRGRKMAGRERERVGLAVAALSAPEVRWCVCAVALPRESWYWLRDWIEFHLRAGASLVAIYDNTGSTGGLRGDSLFYGGQLQREGRSKRGEEYGRLTAHLSDGDIQKGLHGLAARYGEERVKVIPWQPRNTKTGQIVHGQVEAYEDFIRRYRGKLDWCAFIDMDEYLYCRPGLSVGGILEKMGREQPEVGRVVMKGWKFRMRWGVDGPRDIRSHLDHLPLSDGGEKNFIRLCDVVKADIHWYWQMRGGVQSLGAAPEELAFCHYNIGDREMAEGTPQRLIIPRAFLTSGAGLGKGNGG